MIQRIQSVWLLLAAIAVFLTIKFPFYSGRTSADGSFHELTGTTSLWILILSCVLGTCIVITIFLFKQRKIQMRITLLCLLGEILLLYLYIRQINHYEQGNFALWFVLHPAIIILLILAARGIYRDAKLIRESNRLR